MISRFAAGNCASFLWSSIFSKGQEDSPAGLISSSTLCRRTAPRSTAHHSEITVPRAIPAAPRPKTPASRISSRMFNPFRKSCSPSRVLPSNTNKKSRANKPHQSCRRAPNTNREIQRCHLLHVVTAAQKAECQPPNRQLQDYQETPQTNSEKQRAAQHGTHLKKIRGAGSLRHKSRCAHPEKAKPQYTNEKISAPKAIAPRSGLNPNCRSPPYPPNPAAARPRWRV